MARDLLDADSAPPKVWLVSPAIATGVFLAAQVMLAIFADQPSPRAGASLSAAAADAPSAVPVATRVVTQLRNLDAHRVATAKVPDSEAKLLELLGQRGAVVFSAHEVETIGTQETEFDARELGVITADVKLRRAQFVR